MTDKQVVFGSLALIIFGIVFLGMTLFSSDDLPQPILSKDTSEVPPLAESESQAEVVPPRQASVLESPLTLRS